MLDTGVSDETPQLEGQREDVAVVAAVADDEGAVGLTSEDELGRRAADRAPVPAALHRGRGSDGSSLLITLASELDTNKESATGENNITHNEHAGDSSLLTKPIFREPITLQLTPHETTL